MRILVIYPGPTHPNRDGYQTALSAYTEQLIARGHAVDLLCVYDPRTTRIAALADTHSHWGSRLHEYQTTSWDRFWSSFEYRFVCPMLGHHTLDGLCPKGLPAMVRRLVKRHGYEAIIINHWYLSRAFHRLPQTRKIIYALDVFADRLARTGFAWLNTDSRTEGIALDRADAVLAIQEVEAAMLAQCTRTPVFTALSYFEPHNTRIGPAERLLFLASGNKANVDAIRSFMRDVLPAIQRQVPSASLIVGGKVCDSLGECAAQQGVVLQYSISCLSNFYSQGAIVINPVSRGTGLKIKTFEAFSYGRVVLCHPHSVNGICSGLQSPGIVCETPEDYAHQVVRLINDSHEVAALAEQSLAYVTSVNERFRRVLLDVLTDKATPLL